MTFFDYLKIEIQISNLLCTKGFWNNLHQVRPKSKDWKAIKIEVLIYGKKQNNQPYSITAT